jgi:hypothetical protein
MRQGLIILLSTINGVLISLPAAFSLSPIYGLPLIGIFAFAGARIGFKRQNSDGFFYFALISSVVLLSMLMYASFNAQNQQPIEAITAQ